MMNQNEYILFDAGIFIGSLLNGDPRHLESRPLVESARNGNISVCTTTGILSEVYGALTWIKAQPTHSPKEAGLAVRLLVEPPSQIKVLSDGLEATLKMLELAEKNSLTARRIHDARHAATAIQSGITKIYTYDIDDWKIYRQYGLLICGPPSVLIKLTSKRSEK
jgi:predicted nucleic acid-binding protein